MKKSTKLISVILAVVMAFSFIPVIASAGVVPSGVTTVESLIQNSNLASMVDWLLKNLDADKENITDTILRLVAKFYTEEVPGATPGDVDGQGGIAVSDARLCLRAAIKLENYASGSTEFSACDVDGNGKIEVGDARMILRAAIKLDTLPEATETVEKPVIDITGKTTYTAFLDYLDANLPTWTADITSQDWYSTVQSVVKVLGVTLDLKSVNGIIKTLYSVCNKCKTDLIVRTVVGDLKNLNGSALKNITRASGDDKVIYALIEWLEDNSQFVENFIKGGLTKDSSGLNIGSTIYGILDDKLTDINNLVKNIPTFAKSYIYLAIDGKADAGNIKENPAGDWGTSAYKSYTADEMLAAALIRLIQDKEPEETISKSECDAATNMSVYELLATYGPELYNNLAIEPLNTTVKEKIQELAETYPAIGEVLNVNYTFPENLITKADLTANGVIGSLNNILVKIANVMLTPATLSTLNLQTGTNDAQLNNNLTKIMRAALPVFNNDAIEAKLGYSFDAFTADTVKNMSLEQMAVGVLKLFFPTWFDNCTTADLNAADTLEKLGTLAVYYTFTEKVPEDIRKTAGLNSIKLNLATITTADKAYDTIFTWGGKAASAAIAAAKGTDYTMPTTASSYDDYFNSIVDWAVNFVKGFPHAAVEKNIYTTGTGKDYFTKINVCLNDMVNFSFLNGMSNNGYTVDFQKLVFDGLLDNILDFNVAAITDIFAKNSNSSNILNKTTVAASLSLIDTLVSSLLAA